MSESTPFLDIEDTLEKSGFDLEKHSDITKRLDVLPFSKWHVYLVVALGIIYFEKGTTWIFDGYEVSMLSLTSIELQSVFNVSESRIGLLASLYLSGCVIGALIFGSLSLNFGRKKLFGITLGVYIMSVLGLAFSPTFWCAAIFRVFTGDKLI